MNYDSRNFTPKSVSPGSAAVEAQTGFAGKTTVYDGEARARCIKLASSTSTIACMHNRFEYQYSGIQVRCQHKKTFQCSLVTMYLFYF